MSEVREDSCCCGATIRLVGRDGVVLGYWMADWRAAHAICRQSSQHWQYHHVCQVCADIGARCVASEKGAR